MSGKDKDIKKDKSADKAIKEIEVTDPIVETGAIEVEYPVTKSSLEKVDYHNLLETFTVLGIPSAWKPGSPKIKMISKALELLSIVKDLESKGLQGQDLEQAKEVAFVEAEQATKKIAVKEIVNKTVKEVEETKSDLETIVKLNPTKEVAEKNLKLVNANLKNANNAQRKILLKKRAAIQSYIALGDFPQEDN